MHSPPSRRRLLLKPDAAVDDGAELLGRGILGVEHVVAIVLEFVDFKAFKRRLSAELPGEGLGVEEAFARDGADDLVAEFDEEGVFFKAGNGEQVLDIAELLLHLDGLFAEDQTVGIDGGDAPARVEAEVFGGGAEGDAALAQPVAGLEEKGVGAQNMNLLA